MKHKRKHVSLSDDNNSVDSNRFFSNRETNKLGVHFLTDFDGTLTLVPGAKLVYTPFYQSLLKGYKSSGPLLNYQTTPMLSTDDLVERLHEEFDNKSPRDPRRIMASAVSFFKYMVQQDDVRILISTKNRAPYIIAMFRYEGFSADEINRMTIYNARKDENVILFSSNKNQLIPTQIYILDDSKSDLDLMEKAALASKRSFTKVYAHHCNPGAFQWDEYKQSISSDSAARKKVQDNLNQGLSLSFLDDEEDLSNLFR